MKNIKLVMPSTQSPRISGLNDAGIETYKNDPIMSLTKEEIQNSTDGARKINDNSTPCVHVEFKDFYIDTKNLPDITGMRNAFDSEISYWNNQLTHDKRTLAFLQNGKKLLDSNKIRCLRISDTNTTGLTDIGKDAGPWKNLVINTGISDKPGQAGGSFGIGKNAAFACSSIRCVFYNTYNTDEECAFQGVIKLPGYKSNGMVFDGTGFFSINNECSPLMSNESIDPSYSRNEYGLDKYIVGLDEKIDKNDLKKKIIIASITNYLYAFLNNMLIVKYDDVIVSKNTLAELFEEYQDDFDELTREYYDTLTTQNTQIDVSVFDENDVKIYLKMNADAGRRAAITRQTGMKVFDKGNISGRIGFSAVVVLVSDQANRYFKNLENPEHTNWALDRAENKNEAKAYQDKIFKALKDKINELHADETADRMDADGMSEYLPLAYVQSEKDNKRENLSNTVKKKEKGKKTRKAPEQSSETITYEEDEFGNIIDTTVNVKKDPQNHGGGGGGGIPGDDAHPDTDGDVQTHVVIGDGKYVSKRNIPSENVHFALSSTANCYHLKTKLDTAVKSGFIAIEISGEQGAYSSEVLSAKINGKVVETKGNLIRFEKMEPDTINDIEFTLKNKGNWALEVSIHESQK